MKYDLRLIRTEKPFATVFILNHIVNKGDIVIHNGENYEIKAIVHTAHDEDPFEKPKTIQEQNKISMSELVVTSFPLI